MLAREISVNFINMRDYEQARKYLDQSIALAPDQQAAYVFKAVCYWQETGGLPLARQALENMPEVKKIIRNDQPLFPEFTG